MLNISNQIYHSLLHLQMTSSIFSRYTDEIFYPVERYMLLHLPGINLPQDQGYSKILLITRNEVSVSSLTAGSTLASFISIAPMVAVACSCLIYCKYMPHAMQYPSIHQNIHQYICFKHLGSNYVSVAFCLVRPLAMQHCNSTRSACY